MCRSTQRGVLSRTLGGTGECEGPALGLDNQRAPTFTDLFTALNTATDGQVSRLGAAVLWLGLRIVHDPESQPFFRRDYSHLLNPEKKIVLK